eukprot:915135_1
MSLRMIERVYDKPGICRKFREHFSLSDFIMQFKRTTRDNEDEDIDDFHRVMKRLMERQDFWRTFSMDRNIGTMMDSDGIASTKCGGERVKTRDVVAHEAYASDSVSLVRVSGQEGGEVELQAVTQIKSVSGSAQSPDVVEQRGLANEDDPDEVKMQSNSTENEGKNALPGTTDDVKEEEEEEDMDDTIF